MDKNIKRRLAKIEEGLTIEIFDEEKYIEEFTSMLENVLNCNIKNRIEKRELDCTNIDTLERSILRLLTVDELKYISYMDKNN